MPVVQPNLDSVKLLPDGFYLGVIENVEVTTSAGQNPMLVFTFDLVEVGKQLKSYFVITAGGAMKLGVLAAALGIAGAESDPNFDTDQFVGLSCWLTVRIIDFRNNITWYYKDKPTFQLRPQRCRR